MPNKKTSFEFGLSISPYELTKETEKIFKSRDIKLRDALVSSLKSFLIEYPHYYWLNLLVFYKTQSLYYEYQEDELEDFQSGFLVNEHELNFKPQDRFSLYYDKECISSNFWKSSKDYKWSKEKDGDETSFVEVVLNAMNFSIKDFSGENNKYDEFRNAATTYLWFSLQKFTLTDPDAEELACCLWTAFDSMAHDIEEFKADGNVGQDAVDNVLKYILQIDKEKYNEEENPENIENLQRYGDYVHDYVKIAEEILEMDIFDM